MVSVCAGCFQPSDSSSSASGLMGRSARRERGASKHPRAELGRVVIFSCCICTRSRFSIRFRTVGARPDVSGLYGVISARWPRFTLHTLYMIYVGYVRTACGCCMSSQKPPGDFRVSVWHQVNHVMQSPLRLIMASVCSWLGLYGYNLRICYARGKSASVRDGRSTLTLRVLSFRRVSPVSYKCVGREPPVICA